MTQTRGGLRPSRIAAPLGNLNMENIRKNFLAALALPLAAFAQEAVKPEAPADAAPGCNKPAVATECLEPAQPVEAVDAEVVFVLDTTGSMSGLIEGAKQKIWSIAGGIIQRTGGEVRIGLVPYRDRGDAYVTRLFPLTNNLDQVYADLQGFHAAGGGDLPESVNQALNEAVTKIQWSDTNSVMRTIFLVGDCPPHMDYQDDVKYPESCALAASRNIVINTVQCGGEPATQPIWREIARLTNGGYSQIGQSGNMRIVTTPYDVEIQRINIEISKTVLPYGTAAAQSSFYGLLKSNVSAPAPVAASRNAVKAKRMEAYAELDAPIMGQDLTAEPDKLKSIAEGDLPEELKGLSPEARQAKLDEVVAKRRELNAQLVELNRKREEFLREEATRAPAEAGASFDSEVLKSIDGQLLRLRSTKE